MLIPRGEHFLFQSTIFFVFCKMAAHTRTRHDSAPPNRLPSVETYSMTDQKLQVIPLGGLGEFGMNMTAIRYADDIIIVDCGMMFPEAELLGVDLVMPDLTYLKENQQHLRALVLTHGHEDHIGAVPYFLGEM